MENGKILVSIPFVAVVFWAIAGTVGQERRSQAREKESPPSDAQKLDKILERLDSIEKRLTGMEQEMSVVGLQRGWYHKAQIRFLKQKNTAFRANDEAMVEWNGTWWEGTILEVNGKEYRIRYRGWDPSFDEQVTQDRLRIPAQKDSYKRGEEIIVEAGGMWSPGVVMEIKAKALRVAPKQAVQEIGLQSR
jgi:hypothetical protein